MATKTAKKKVGRPKKSESDGNGARPAKLFIPPLEQGTIDLLLYGERMMVNNKMATAEEVAETYDPAHGGKMGQPKPRVKSKDEQYAGAFYAMPSSRYAPPNAKGKYGIPTSGIKKCACSAIRSTGITDNTTVGMLAKSFIVHEDEGGLCELKFKKLERDIRPVNIGSGQKTVPRMAHRPMFLDWSVKVRITFNTKVLTAEQVVNLFMHAGAYIGLCEMRAEKKQGSCGGFAVKPA